MSDKFVMSARQAAELDHAFERNGFTSGDVKLLSGGTLLGDVQKVLHGQARIESGGDTLIRITRPVRPKYDSIVKKVLHPELEDEGPGEYDLACIQLLLDADQVCGGIVGHVLYTQLKEDGDLKSCLGLRDAEEIQKKGVDIFRQFFGGKHLFLWKSIYETVHGDTRVPYLFCSVRKLHVGGKYLDSVWENNDPAAFLRSEALRPAV